MMAMNASIRHMKSRAGARALLWATQSTGAAGAAVLTSSAGLACETNLICADSFDWLAVSSDRRLRRAQDQTGVDAAEAEGIVTR